MTRNIVPECYVDTKIAEIVSRAKKYNHQHGSGNVTSEMERKLINFPALGIIDEDKKKGVKSRYWHQFTWIAEENNLLLKKHPERLHYIIHLCPECEEWLLFNAMSVSVNPENYGLDSRLTGLVEFTKKQDIDRHLGFYQFIKELLNKEAPGITTLRKWIEDFNKNALPKNA